MKSTLKSFSIPFSCPIFCKMFFHSRLLQTYKCRKAIFTSAQAWPKRKGSLIYNRLKQFVAFAACNRTHAFILSAFNGNALRINLTRHTKVGEFVFKLFSSVIIYVFTTEKNSHWYSDRMWVAKPLNCRLHYHSTSVEHKPICEKITFYAHSLIAPLQCLEIIYCHYVTIHFIINNHLNFHLYIGALKKKLKKIRSLKKAQRDWIVKRSNKHKLIYTILIRH